MIRRGMAEDGYLRDSDPNFRWRSPEVSRTENLSDIIFAMSLTLIATSSAPDNYAQLLGLWREAISTAFCLALLLMIWFQHYVFFRRYALEDARTVWLNSFLLFLILKFAATTAVEVLVVFMGYVLGMQPDSSRLMNMIAYEDVGRLLALYSVGYLCLFILFAGMYRHALGQADRMDLNAVERVLTRSSIYQSLVHCCVAVIVIAAGVLLPYQIGAFAGWGYFLIWPGMLVVSRWETRALKALEDQRSG